MKIVILTLTLCCLMATRVMAASEEPVGTPIDFTVELNTIDPSDHGHQHPRTPVRPPKASMSDHTLHIQTAHPDYPILLLSSDETVVFESYIPSSVNEILLPSYLTGNYKLQLQSGRFSFTGEIELQ